MTRAVWLRARIARPNGVAVFVRLDAEETRFAESGETPPEGLVLALRADPNAENPATPSLVVNDAEHEIPLPVVLLALWPGASEALLDHCGRSLRIDNRMDLEAALEDLAALLAELLRWWRTRDERWRVQREQKLVAHWPAWRTLLEDCSLPARASKGEAPRPDFPGPRNGEGIPPDEEHWAAWTARDSAGILGPDGGLARLLGEGFEARPGQVDMSERLARVLEREEHLMVEAGTGIGKSLAYLVPTLLHGARTGERVVISTHTRNLQSQLVDHDLPLLERLGYPGRVRLLLGRNNYLCRRQLRRAMQHEARDRAEAIALFALGTWSQQSVEGRREELSDHPWFEREYRPYFESFEPCSPHICHRDPVCFVVQARRVAREAQVVVVNHSLLMMDLRSSQSLVGPARLLVVDEAHHLPDVATRGLSHFVGAERLEVYRNLTGDRLHPTAMREVLEQLVRAGRGEESIHDAAQRADRALEEFLRGFVAWFEAVEREVAERLGSGTARAASHRIHDGAEAFGAVRALAAVLEEAGRELEEGLAALLAVGAELEEQGANIGEEREGLASLLEFHREFTAQIRFCQAADDEDWVYWFEWGGESGLRAVVAAPLTVEEPLAALWDAYYRSVVMTSATLAVETDFLPFAESVGFSRVQRFTDSLQVPSPFAAEQQSLVLTSLDLPSPDDPRFVELVADAVAAIAGAVRTKTLVLSTSYRFLDQLEPLLRERLWSEGEDLFAHRERIRPEILVQRPGIARTALADRFRRAEAAILLATGSFWEGVDFPGQQLEVLVVPRLPFAVPTDPLVEGRTERARRLGRDAFQDVTLVDAVLRLKQGVGRLLRTREDRGAVLLLDQRLQTKSYGVRFLNSLPRLCEIVPDVDEITRRTVEFLARRGESRR